MAGERVGRQLGGRGAGALEAARWNGIYAKHPTEPVLVARPAPGATVIACAGGAGMTLSFGIAERTVADVLEGDCR